MHFELKLHARSRRTCQCRFFIFSTPDLRAFARRASSLCLCRSAGIRFPVFISEAVTVFHVAHKHDHPAPFKFDSQCMSDARWRRFCIHSFAFLRLKAKLDALFPVPTTPSEDIRPPRMTHRQHDSKLFKWWKIKWPQGGEQEEAALHSVCATVCVKKAASNEKGLV